MFGIIQIVLVIVLIAVIIVYFGKIRHAKKSLIAGLVFCIAISAVISNAVLNIIPLPTEKVIVTATGEKNEAASSNEAYIINLIVGGEEYELTTPSEGKWFWKGDSYMWRHENNPNKPEGVTRSITIDMPYGCGRSIQFGLSKWNGIVEVSYGGETKSYDLFKVDDMEETVLYAPIPDTDFFALYGIKLLRLGLFLLIIALLTAYPIYAAIKFDYATIKSFSGKHWDKLYYITLALTYVMVLQSMSEEGSLWSDEIWQLSWIYTGYPNGAQVIFNILTNIWYKIMPYGQEYLRLLSQLFVAGTIYFTGIAGSLYKNKRFGIIFSSTIAFSLSIFSQCGMEIRVYAMLLFSFSFVLYMYIRKQKNICKEKISELIIYGISLALLMDAHSFGVPAAGLFMISDFILILLRKTSKKAWIEFIIPAVYGVFWLIDTWQVTTNGLGSNTGNNWVGKATPARLLDTMRWIFSYNDILFSMFLLGVIIIIFKFFTSLQKKTFDFKSDYATITITFVPLIFIALIFFYSTVLNPINSLIIDRYFMSVIVGLYFIMCYGCDSIIAAVGKLLNSKKAEQSLLVFALCTMCIYNCTQFSAWDKYPAAYRSKNQDFRSSIENVMAQNDCYNSSTILITDYNKAVDIGLQYYTTHKGTRDDINHVSILGIDDEVLSYNTIYISYVWGRDRQNEQLNSILDSEFKLVSDNTTAKVKKYVKK